MVVLEDVGEFSDVADKVLWSIPNFYDLPQEYDTVIRSPRLRFKEKDWYIQVYPNGCSLYCTSGWFGISSLNLNPDSTCRTVSLSIKNSLNVGVGCITVVGQYGLYNNVKFLPTSLLRSSKNTLVPEGNLQVCFKMVEEGNDDNKFCAILSKEAAYEFFNAYKQAFGQTEKEIDIPSKIIDVGRIVNRKTDKKWIIPNFCEMSQEYNTILRSPRVRFQDTECYMEIYPNGSSLYGCSSGWFGIGIFNLNSDADFYIRCLIGNAEQEALCKSTRINLDGKTYYNCMKIIPFMIFKFIQNCLLQEGDLHVYLELESATDFDEQDNTALFLKQQNAVKCFEAYIQAIGQTEENIVNKDMKLEHGEANRGEAKAEKESGFEKLQQDLEEMFQNGNISDVVLKVDGQEFKAHRCILAARSTVFRAMMTHETKEKISGIVDIPDVDSNVFSDFLHYLYTGSVEKVTPQNAVKLYTVADKYQVDELKKTCLRNIFSNISVDNFCDVIVLSLQHSENDLKEACIQFFNEHSLDIILTPKWQTFLSENPIIGNELFIKHLQISKRV